MLTPPSLFPGAKVALVGPSSAVPEEKLDPALALVRSLGLEPVLYPSSCDRNRHGCFAAGDAQRARDLTDAFLDPDIAGVWCIRGGYGAHRLLPLLDFDVFSANPKWFGGYSDVTALHTALNQVCGMVTYHVPMPSTEPVLDNFTLLYLKKALFGGLTGPLPNPPGLPTEMLAPGRAKGLLCGGNLSLLAAGLGTPWEVDTVGKLLFLEDIGEKTYRIDGMLTSLRNAGKFADCAGVILGAWTDCPPEDPSRALTLSEIFQELIVPAGKPVLAGVACGHVLPTLSLPMGAPVRLDAGAGTLEALE